MMATQIAAMASLRPRGNSSPENSINNNSPLDFMEAVISGTVWWLPPGESGLRLAGSLLPTRPRVQLSSFSTDFWQLWYTVVVHDAATCTNHSSTRPAWGL